MIFNDINLKELFELMTEYGVYETTLRDQEIEVAVKRGSTALIEPNPGHTVTVSRADAALSDTAAPAAAAETPPEPKDDNSKYYGVVAPLVGTFYRAPSPEADVFVEVGDRVNPGDVLCIVEAMKSMNEIQSEVSGVVKSICVENAQMVEFEQVLFRIDTA